MKKSIHNLVYALSGFLFFLSWTITNHHAPWNTFYQEFLALAGIFFLFPWRKSPSTSKNIFSLITLWCSVLTAQYFIQKIYFGDYLFGIGVISILWMSYLSGKQSFYRENSTEINNETVVYATILAAALANSIVGLSQWLGVSANIFSLPSPTYRVYGNMAQPNQLATLLALGLISLIHFDAKKQVNTFWLLVTSAVLSFTLASTGSRTGALSFTVLIVIILFFYKNFKVFTALRWLAPAFVIFWLTYTNWSLLAIGGNSRTVLSFSSSGRLELWEQMIMAIGMKPWLGWGWLNLGEAQYAAMKASSLPVKINIDHAHNIFMDFFIWFGIPFGFFLIFKITKFFLESFHLIKENSQNHSRLIAFLMLTPIGIHSLLEYPFAYIYFLIPIGFFIGQIENSNNLTTQNTTKQKTITFAAAISTVIFSGIIAFDYYKIEKDFFAARLEKEFFTETKNRHQYDENFNFLTQYKSLLHLAKSDQTNSPEISQARKTTMRFPWLSSHKQYYVELLRNKECFKAGSQIEIIERLFGEFGVAKTEEAAIHAGLTDNCSEIIRQR